MAHTALAFDEPHHPARFRIARYYVVSPLAAFAQARITAHIEARGHTVVSMAAGAMEREDGLDLFPVTDVLRRRRGEK